jgi:RNA polymerase sigma factor (sigma-70 family)
VAIPCDDPPATSADGRGRATNAFDDFFSDRYPGAVRLAHLLTGSNAVAEELAQDAFAHVFPRFADLREPKSYLRATVVNVCRNWHRAHRRELDRFRRHGVTDDHTTDSLDELIELIASLPYRQRAVLVMRYWLDLTEADIARSLGCRPGTVKSLHSRALAAIRKDLP